VISFVVVTGSVVVVIGSVGGVKTSQVTGSPSAKKNILIVQN
jgi:hypothetical protein